MIAVGSTVVGKDPPTLETWKTTDGHESKAMLHSFDKDAGTITLLVPKTIPLDRLDESSRILVENSQKGGDPQFTLKNTMSDPTYAEWQSATDEEKIALTGTWVFGLIRNGLASRKLSDAVQNANDLNPLALELYAQIEISVMGAKDSDPSFDPSKMKLSQIVAITTKAAGWLDEKRVSNFGKDNPRPANDANGVRVGNVQFSDLKLQAVGDRFRLLGKVANAGQRDVQMGTYHLNFHVAGELSDVESLIVLDLKAGQQQTFKAELFNVSQRPDLSTMTITPKGVVSLGE
ncbi:hypothetical protein [Rubripirellula lacrimiformis]|uniref:hypothetical protein n=1 Tax=Rubripirellula lacrimiformis TaxID=1930273 RepID=UPI001C54DA45|nr:hypothetical protein [Rubripirellula lacrimiformis]